MIYRIKGNREYKRCMVCNKQISKTEFNKHIGSCKLCYSDEIRGAKR